MMMQQQTNTNSAVPITTAAGILNLDHYKYLRSLLPPVPHFIESLSFTDLNNWECQIYVNLLTESDCMKWLADFEEKTSTDWRVDKDASRVLSQTNKVKGCHWQMVYRCIPNDSKKECTAKLEMKIMGQDENDRTNRNGKQYPCQVSINFYHNHNTTNNTMFNMESFKSQDIPSHLKEGFEGYFQETMQPTNNITTTVNLNAIKPQHTLLNSPLTHSISNNAQVVIKTEVPLSPVGQHLDGKLLNRQNHEVFDLAEVSQKLDMTLEVLRTMLKQTGTACAAVKQFVDKFDRLKGDQNQLEDALTSFGGQWDWLVATDNNTHSNRLIKRHNSSSNHLHSSSSCNSITLFNKYLLQPTIKDHQKRNLRKRRRMKTPLLRCLVLTLWEAKWLCSSLGTLKDPTPREENVQDVVLVLAA